jgi:hypothetical protein
VLERLPPLGAGLGQPVGVGDVRERLDLGLRDQAALARRELAVVVLEGTDRDVRRAVPPQLLDSLLERQ